MKQNKTSDLLLVSSIFLGIYFIRLKWDSQFQRYFWTKVLSIQYDYLKQFCVSTNDQIKKNWSLTNV